MTDFHTPLGSAIQARRRGQPLLLFLDYDGTLVEIASRPELARPTSELIELLSRLTARPDLKVMMVSGRPLWELQELLPVPGLDFLGSHGGEAFISGHLHLLQAAAVESQELFHWRSRVAVMQPHPFVETALNNFHHLTRRRSVWESTFISQTSLSHLGSCFPASRNASFAKSISS